MGKKIWFGSLAAATLLGSILIGVQAEPPDPHNGASMPVRERNIDTNGWIAVHEQGIADVEVVGGTLDVTGSVSVDNFPAVQSVTVNGGSMDVNVTGGTLDVNANLPSVTVIESDFVFVAAGEQTTFNFPTVQATSISFGADEDEFYIQAFGPLGMVMGFANLDADRFVVTESFTYPVPIDSIVLSCENEQLACGVYVSVHGF